MPLNKNYVILILILYYIVETYKVILLRRAYLFLSSKKGEKLSKAKFFIAFQLERRRFFCQNILILLLTTFQQYRIIQI